MNALVTPCIAGGFKIGMVFALVVCGILVGAAIGFLGARQLSDLPVTDRHPAIQALRIVDRIASAHGLTRSDMLKAMMDIEDRRSPPDRTE